MSGLKGNQSITKKNQADSVANSVANATAPGTSLEDYLRKKKPRQGASNSGGQLKSVLNYNDKLG
jgi:hypothetical protein